MKRLATAVHFPNIFPKSKIWKKSKKAVPLCRQIIH